MLKKANRLLKKKDFDAVWQKGRSSFDKALGIKSLSTGLKLNRFGIMIGLKVSKKAVERNRIKRRIREILRAEANNLPIGFDIVIAVLPAARTLDYQELRNSLVDNLKRLRLIGNLNSALKRRI
ncbi:MAG TPA: ribonuclease P protein component [Candidatus Nanoarchaeia archaeon]|nr:ribonuclease P protein component [Candidatus Nanoarchaeia archaeon]